MRLTGFLIFVTLQREITSKFVTTLPFGKARSATSRETYTNILNTKKLLAEIHESWLRKDEIEDENNKKGTNSAITKDKSENKVPLERKDAYVDGKHVRRHDLCEIKLDDIQWNRNGTDLILSLPFLTSPLPVNEVSNIKNRFNNVNVSSLMEVTHGGYCIFPIHALTNIRRRHR